MIVLDEIKELADKIHDAWWDRYRRVHSELEVWPLLGQGNNGKTDGSGNAAFQIYENVTQRTLLIGRVILLADGNTPATPYSNNACYAYLAKGIFQVGQQFPNAQILDFFPKVAGGQVFPNVVEYSSRNALRLGKNDVLSLFVVGGPASVNLSAFLYGELLPPKISSKTVV